MARPVSTPLSVDQRTRIGTVAEALFAERGFEGTPVREIAHQAGSTKALIYHYYRNKEDLYLSLLEAAVSKVVTQVEKIAASGDPPDHKIRGVVEAFLEFYRAHPQRFQMVQRAIDEPGATATTLAERWFSRAHLALQTIAAEGVRQGTFKPLPPQMVPFVVIGLIIHALRSHHLLRGRINPDLSGTQLFNTLADLILALLGDNAREEQKPRGRERKKSTRTE